KLQRLACCNYTRAECRSLINTSNNVLQICINSEFLQQSAALACNERLYICVGPGILECCNELMFAHGRTTHNVVLPSKSIKLIEAYVLPTRCRATSNIGRVVHFIGRFCGVVLDAYIYPRRQGIEQGLQPTAAAQSIQRI